MIILCACYKWKEQIRFGYKKKLKRYKPNSININNIMVQGRTTRNNSSFLQQINNLFSPFRLINLSRTRYHVQTNSQDGHNIDNGCQGSALPATSSSLEL